MNRFKGCIRPEEILTMQSVKTELDARFVRKRFIASYRTKCKNIIFWCIIHDVGRGDAAESEVDPNE